jgi:hypothetical protein
MAKTKISEFSATPANNTDIDGINIAEGCAPSGINDAIRELMAQLKDWQSGTSNDPYVIGSSGSLTLNQGTANGVPYLNGSKVVTSGSALTFDGTNLATTGSVTSAGSSNSGNLAFTGTGNRITGDFSNATVANRAMFQTSTVNTASDVGIIPNGTASTASVSTFNSSAPDNSAFLGLSITSSEARLRSSILGTGTYLPMTFQTGGSERMRVDTSGNFYVGTTSQSGGSNITFNQPANADMKIAAGVSTGTRASYQVFINNTVTTVGTENSSGGSLASGTSAYSTVLANSGAYPISFATNNTERARIDSSGNMFLGGTTSTYGSKLVLYSSGGSNIIESRQTSTSAQYHSIFMNSNGAVGSIQTSGSSTSYSTSSDYRLKNTIAPMTGALAKVAALKPCTYKWNIDGSDGEGFIAHELAEVVPGCVTGEKDAVDADGNPQYQGIDTSFLVATLTAAIQELKAEFDAYKATHP